MHYGFSFALKFAASFKRFFYPFLLSAADLVFTSMIDFCHFASCIVNNWYETIKIASCLTFLWYELIKNWENVIIVW